MEGNTIPVSENTTVIVKVSGDLFLQGEGQGEVHFLSSEDRIKVNQSNDNIYIETHASLDLVVPLQAPVIVEKVGGSAFIQDLEGALVVQKIGGDLALRRLGDARVEKVGGICLVEDVSQSLAIGKVGGDLTVRQASGAVEVGSIGGEGNLEMRVIGPLEARSGGDLRLFVLESIAGPVIVRAGGMVEINLPAEVNGSFNLVSDGEDIKLVLNHQEQVFPQNIDARRYEFSLGQGTHSIEVRAGGDIVLSDEGRVAEPISSALDRRENAWKEARERRGFSSWSGGYGFDRNSAWADMISRRAQEASRRAEQRAHAAMRRTEEQIRQAAERDLRRSGMYPGMGVPNPPPPPPPPAPSREPVSEKERLFVLQMLQEQKITVDEAEKLLAALEGRYNR